MSLFNPFELWESGIPQTTFMHAEIGARVPRRYAFVAPGQEVLSNTHTDCTLIVTGAPNQHPFLVYHELPIFPKDIKRGVHNPQDFSTISPGYASSFNRYHYLLQMGEQPHMWSFSNKTYDRSILKEFMELMRAHALQAYEAGWAGFEQLGNTIEYQQIQLERFNALVTCERSGALRVRFDELVYPGVQKTPDSFEISLIE